MTHRRLTARRRASIAAALAALAAATPAAALDYLGERCWRRSDGITTRVGITQVGDGHFLLAGAADSSGPGQTTPVHGNAERLGGQVFMSLHFTGEDASRTWSGSARAILDAATLDGTVEVFEVFHLKSDPDPFGAVTAHQPAASFLAVPCP